MASLAGQTVDKYEVVAEVGYGGMATVYRARDTHLDRDVALKVLHPHLANDPESRQRFGREARTTARLRHDNIVSIYEWSGDDSADGYIVTEFIEGQTLREWIDQGHHSRPYFAALVIHRLCLALAHAHEQGIIHRDLKPENVMVRRDGCIKLMDFGIARILDHQKLTMTGQLLGSPAYMAPELITDKPVDARTDIFSVGIMLYQLATGCLPFAGRNPHEVLNKIADALYRRPATVNPQVDEELEAIIAKALAREPDGRFSSAQAMSNELEDYLHGCGLSADAELLSEYFREPEACADRVDSLVAAHVVVRAEKAQAEGNPAKTIRLATRALELRPTLETAKRLIERAKRRTNTMRRVMVGAGIVVGVGLVAAVMQLWHPPTPQVDAIRGGRVDEDAGVFERERETTLATDSRNSGGRVRKGGGKAPTTAGGGNGTGNGGGVIPGGVRDGAAGKLVVTSPRKGVMCTVVVEGLPAASLAGTMYLHVGGQRVKMNQGSATATIPPDGVDVQLRLSETAKRYSGTLNLTPSGCPKGSVTLTAVPARARVLISDLPADVVARSVVVSCVTGCTAENTADKFSLDVPAEPGVVSVQLRFRATGFDDSLRSFQLLPGPNSVAARLTRI